MSCKATRRIGYALDGVNFFVAAMQASFGVFVTVYLAASQTPSGASFEALCFRKGRLRTRAFERDT